MDDNTQMEGCAQKDDTIRMENGVPLDTTTGMENSAQVKNKTQNDDTVPTEQAQAAEMKEEKKCYCCHKKKERSEKEYKDLMLAQSDIFVALPGGVGTLDEIFTIAAAHTIQASPEGADVVVVNTCGFLGSVCSLA